MDQTNKRRNLAGRQIASVTKLIQALNELVEQADEYTSSGLQYQDTDFQGSAELEHVDAAAMIAVITSTGSLNTWLSSTFNDDNFKKVIK